VLQEVQAIDKSEMELKLSDITFERLNVTNKIAVRGLLGRLHQGEVEVMVGALEKGVLTVVLDESAARNKAKQLGLEVTGTLGILLKAHKQGLIDDVLQEIDKLKQEGMYLSDSIIEKIKRSL
jgi:predicted nucleic acid-binding protein